jgi:hypothetical protein
MGFELRACNAVFEIESFSLRYTTQTHRRTVGLFYFQLNVNSVPCLPIEVVNLLEFIRLSMLVAIGESHVFRSNLNAGVT